MLNKTQPSSLHLKLSCTNDSIVHTCWTSTCYVCRLQTCLEGIHVCHWPVIIQTQHAQTEAYIISTTTQFQKKPAAMRSQAKYPSLTSRCRLGGTSSAMLCRTIGRHLGQLLFCSSSSRKAQPQCQDASLPYWILLSMGRLTLILPVPLPSVASFDSRAAKAFSLLSSSFSRFSRSFVVLLALVCINKRSVKLPVLCLPPACQQTPH